MYKQIVCIPMGTYCAPLVEDLFLFCYENDFMLSLSANNQADVVEASNSSSRYLDDQGPELQCFLRVKEDLS